MTVILRAYGQHGRIRKRLMGDLRVQVHRTGDGFYVGEKTVRIPVVRRGNLKSIVAVLPSLAGTEVPLPNPDLLNRTFRFHFKPDDTISLTFNGPVFRLAIG